MTLLSTQLRLMALGMLLLAVAVTVLADLRLGRRREVGELALLLALFAAAPPLLVVRWWTSAAQGPDRTGAGCAPGEPQN